jgi:hypothetical protein
LKKSKLPVSPTDQLTMSNEEGVRIDFERPAEIDYALHVNLIVNLIFF